MQQWCDRLCNRARMRAECVSGSTRYCSLSDGSLSIGAGALVSAVRVTLIACHGRVRTGERELRLGMVECRWLPCRR